MKIRFLITNAYVGGGIVRTTFNTAAELAATHDVEIVSLLRRRDKPQFPFPEGVRVRALLDRRPGAEGTGGPLRRLSRNISGRLATKDSRLIPRGDLRYGAFDLETDLYLLRYLRSLKDGAIIGTRPGLNVAIARWTRSSVVRVGQDHMHLRSYSANLKQAMRTFYPRLDAATSLTQDDTARFEKMLAGTARVEWIPNGVPVAGSKQAALEAPLVIAAGRLARQKGFDRLLDIWAKVSADAPEWRLEIYGRGPDGAALRDQIDRLGIQDTARLMGHTSRMHDRMAAASVYAMTSRHEGLPMTLLEAGGHGLPCVAYDCPTGPSEIIINQETGYLVPNGDSAEFSHRLLRLMHDPALRRSFGDVAAASAMRFDLAVTGRRWHDLLTELAADKG